MPQDLNKRDLQFFSFCPDNGIELHSTAEEAAEATRLDIAYYREAAMSEGEWADEVERCFWGEIKGRAVAESDETGTDYHLESTNA